MKKQALLLIIFVIGAILGLTSCKDDNSNDGKRNNVKGLVEKGPFVAGSLVTVYELDNNLHGTGRVFTTTTNDVGAFTLQTTIQLASKYVKVAVDGFYFNEYTGAESQSRIIMEAITSIENPNVNINVNVLTHLEMPRVLKLVSTGLSFEDAKKQAQKEVLGAFLIKDHTVIPEEASITTNNTSANILIAVSSVLLYRKTDARFSEFMGQLRSDLEDGNITSALKDSIAESSLGLRYSMIKENIINKYNRLGKPIEVGDFELFIDGDGDGLIGTSYEEEPAEIKPDDIFKSEEDVKKFMTALVVQMYKFIQHQYLFDGIYTNTVSEDKLNQYDELRSIYNHSLTSRMGLPRDLWITAYQAMTYDNKLVEQAEISKHDWFKKYKYYGQTYRAYKYLNMINLWGDVVISKSSDIYIKLPKRTPQADVLEYIIKELEEASKNITDETYYQSQCSKYFTFAILAKAYLQKKDYTKALSCVNTIIKSGKFELSTDRNSIYNGGNKEIIFELPNSDDYSTTPYRELIKKGNYIALCRYTEVLLIAAEANLKLGNKAKCADLLNLIIQRNKGTLVNEHSDLESALLKEWKDDLRNEGLMFSTLKRFGKAKEYLNIEDYQLVIPIPLSEIQANSNIKQNEGYK